MKQCSTCKQTKSLADFYKQGSGYRFCCKLCWKSRNQKYYTENSEDIKSNVKQWIAANRSRHNKYASKYRRRNLGRFCAYAAKRNAAKLQRTPKWADLEAIRRFYEACPPGMAVDHIYPLQGELCSGLHVLENLQYLSPLENSRKGNRMPC